MFEDTARDRDSRIFSLRVPGKDLGDIMFLHCHLYEVYFTPPVIIYKAVDSLQPNRQACYPAPEKTSSCTALESFRFRRQAG